MGGSSKKVTVGYKYYVGKHMVICKGPVDYVRGIRVDERELFHGVQEEGTIFVDKKNLFGGEEREGGISGDIDFAFGGSTQSQNNYLVKKLGASVPAFRGVLSAILNRVYLGANPYLKPWDFRVQRIHTRQEGITQWYDEKSEIRSTIGSKLINTVKSNWDAQDPNIVYQPRTGHEYPPPDSLHFDTNGLSTFVRVTLREDEYLAYSHWETDLEGPPTGPWMSNIQVSIDGGPHQFVKPLAEHEASFHTEQAAFDSYIPTIVSADATYDFFLVDSPLTDNRGGISPTFEFWEGYVQYDMNPAHIIRECITDQDWGMGYLDADVDNDSFVSAANTIFEEFLGISMLWDKQVKLEDFIVEILRHIDASLYLDRQTGKFVLKLIRDDYNENTIPTIGESSIIKVKAYSRPSVSELVNSVTVIFENAETGNNETVIADDPSLIAEHGFNSTTVQYPGFSIYSNASKAARRDLKTLSSPLLSATIQTTRSSYNINVGDVFKFEWPDYHDGYVVMRVKTISFGDGKSNQIEITCIEDIFHTPELPLTTREASGWTSPVSLAGDIEYVNAQEATYYELVLSEGQPSVDDELAIDSSIGYINSFAAHTHEGGYINGKLWVDAGAGYLEIDQVDFCPVGVLSLPYGKSNTTLNFSFIDNADDIEIGSHGVLNGEIMSVVSVDPVSKTISVHRGCIDTTPTTGQAGDAFIIYSDYSVSDDIQYVNGESVDIKIPSLTGNGLQDLNSANINTVVMDSRAVRPYPPGNLKLNGSLFPEQIQDSIDITWSHRDRLQQTASHFAYTTGDVGPEPGTTYDVSIKYSNGDLLESATGITETSFSVTNPIGTVDDTLTIELQTFRDGFEATNKYLFTVQYIDSSLYVPSKDFVTNNDSYTPSNNFTI